MADKKKTVETAAPAADKKKALDTAIAQIEKDFGKGAIMRLGENTHIVVEAILTEQGYTGLQSTMDPGLHWRVVEAGTESDGTG